MSRTEIAAALEQIFGGITRLNTAFPHRAFTIDGPLVGDVGEVTAAFEYDLVLDPVSRPIHDAKTSDGRDVWIKATFKVYEYLDTTRGEPARMPRPRASRRSWMVEWRD